MKRWLAGMLAFAMTLSAAVFSPAVMAEENDEVASRFVVASDVHLNEKNATQKQNTYDRLPLVFRSAYAYAAEQGGSIDAFVFNGDSIDGNPYNSDAADLRHAAEWTSFFNIVKQEIKDGSKFMPAFARTHDIYNGDGNTLGMTEESMNALLNEILGTDGSIIPEADWGFGAHLTMVGGVPVITLSNDMSSDVTNINNHYHNSYDWLKEKLDALVAEKAEQPIFVVYHYPESGGSLEGSVGSGQLSLQKLLCNYPQVIAINAHTHRDPRQARSIMQENYTELYDGVVSYTQYTDGTALSKNYDVSTYSVIEVMKSGAVEIKYIDPRSGALIKDGNGSGEALCYSIPAAWDPSTWAYTEEQRLATALPYFGAEAGIRVENNTLVFDRAESALSMLYYKLELSDGTDTETYTVSSEFYIDPLPAVLSFDAVLQSGVTYTAKITGVDSMYRETANLLEATVTVEDTDLKAAGGIAAPAADAITVGTAAELMAVLTSGESYEGKTIVQTADIDLRGQILAPAAAFKGTLDGNGFTVNNLFVNGSGLFEKAENATFKNLNLCGTVLNTGAAASIAGSAENCTFLNCMNGMVVISTAGDAACYAIAEGCTFTNCIFDGSLYAPAGEGMINAGSLASTSAVKVEGKQLLFNSENGTIKRSLADPSRHVDWSFDESIDSAEEWVKWLLGGAPEAALGTDLDLNTLYDRFGIIAGLGLTASVDLKGNYHVIKGGNATLTGGITDLGATDLQITGSNCWDGGDFTAEALQSGEAAYALGSWAQGGDTPAGAGKVVKITFGAPVNQVKYLNAGTAVAVESPCGYTADRADFTVAEDTIVTYTAHAADKTALQEKLDAYGELNAHAFTAPETYTAAVAAAEAVLTDAAADADAVAAAVTAFETALESLALAGDQYENYPEVAHYEAYRALFGEVTKWAIHTRADLDAWSAWSKSHNGAGMEFHMTQSIDMQNRNFGMIGSFALPFSGTFNGHLNTLSNLLIEDTLHLGTGFFVFAKNAKISNFGIESGLIRGTVMYRAEDGVKGMCDRVGVGSIAGGAERTDFRHVWNCADVTYKPGDAVSYTCYAGLVGRSAGYCSFVGCYNTGDVVGINRASGICGWTQNGAWAARISNCFNIGRMEAGVGLSEAIARYSNSTEYCSYLLYNNYYLNGCADASVGTNGNDNQAFIAYSVGAEEPVSLTAKEIGTQLAELLNEKRYSGYLADTATWVQGDNGYPVIASVDDSGESEIYPFSQYAEYPDAKSFSISGLEEFLAFAAASKEDSFAEKTIYLNTNIDLSETESFAMIGSAELPFAGTFDGRAHTISGLTLESNEAQLALFRQVDGAKLRNFTVSGANIICNATSNAVISGSFIAALSTGKTEIENVHAKSSTISAAAYGVGGIINIGWNNGGATLKNCSVDGCTITGGGQRIGGLVGNYGSSMTIENCYVVNSTVKGSRYVGLLVGYARSTTVKNCYTYGNSLVYTGSGNAGLAFGSVNTAASLTNCVFYEATVNDTVAANLSSTATGLTAQNVYNTKETDVVAIRSVTQAQLDSGEVAYALGWAMEKGKIAFADADTRAAEKYTYMVDEAVYDTRYTDGAGEMIGFAVAEPVKAGYLFAGWTVSQDGTVFTAEFDQNWSVNGDLKVELADVILVLQHLVGYDVEIDLACADINKDGRVSIFDAVKLLQYYAAL